MTEAAFYSDGYPQVVVYYTEGETLCDRTGQFAEVRFFVPHDIRMHAWI